MKKKIIIYLVVFIFGLTAFLLSALFAVLILYFLFSDEERTVKEKKISHEYQSFQYDPSKNKTYFGVVCTFNELPKTDVYHSYQNDKGNYVLISEFGSEEYECTGICYCEEERRSTSVILRKPILYFVAALSFVLAFDSAKQYFQDECHESLDDNCHSSKIKSEINSCERVIDLQRQYALDPNKDYITKKAGYETTTPELNSEGKNRRFHCKGTCYTSESIIDYLYNCDVGNFFSQGLNDMRATPKLEKDHRVTDLWLKTEICDDFVVEGEVTVQGRTSEYLVKEKFEKEYGMVEYCKLMALFDEKDYENIGKDFEDYFEKKEDLQFFDGEKTVYSWCNSREYGTLKNYNCREIPY